MKIVPLTLGLLVAAGAARAAEPVRAWSGPRVVVKTRHLQPALKSNEEYGDKYTFNADFGERGSFYYSVSITNLGPGDEKLEVKSRLTLDGHRFSSTIEKGKGGWKSAKGDEFAITAGASSISGTPDKLVFVNEKGGDAFELTFTPIARPWRPRDGQLHFGKDRYVFDVTLFPLSKVEARYRQNGGEWQTIEGTGWGSHTWADRMPYNHALWELQFRGIEGESAVYMRELGLTSEYGGLRIPYVLIVQGNQVLMESYDYQFNPTSLMTDEQHQNRYRVPEAFTLLGADFEDKQRQFRAVVKKKTLKNRRDALKEMNALLRAIVSSKSKPVLYDYDVDFTFEVRNGAETHRIQGVGAYEVNHYNR